MAGVEVGCRRPAPAVNKAALCTEGGSQIQGCWTARNREIPEIFHVQADISFESF